MPLSRMRVRGDLLEIRAADLAFTIEETEDFINRGMNLALRSDQIALLTERTEGWPAGLQMAALSLQGSADIDARIASFTGLDRFVLDFLLEGC
jgi:LuxR family maltose regulon positive regulatory protein